MDNFLEKLMFRKPVVILLVLCSLMVVPVWAIGEDTTSIPGEIALVGADYNIYTYNFAASTLTPLSQDGSRTRHYQWPTWSTDGRVAYFCCDLNVAQSADAQVYIASDSLTQGELVYEQSAAAIIYAYWSPANCVGANSATCRDLALLVNTSGGLAIEMLQHQPGATTYRTIASGSPFYYHWNPEGTQLIFHRNSNQLDIFDIAQNDVSTAFDEQSSGLFQAPAWSPVDNRILFGVRGGAPGQTNLVITDGDTLETIVENVTGFVSFLWSPDGNYIAYRTFNRGDIGAVIVVDSRTGEEVSRSASDGVIAFFWSPDSSKIAYLTITEQSEGRILAGWTVLNIELDSNVQYSSFVPTYEMGYLLQYFDQFSPSHRLWSPDSRYLVYSEIVEADGGFLPQISVIDVNQPASSPVKISDGVFAVWSYE
jgi:TolB protein